MAKGQKTRVKVPLQPRVTCSHCWHQFPPEQVLWVSAHPDLRNDPLLGADQQQRFLPTRFTVEGHALDVRGLACKELACPRCHLKVPRAALEMESLYLSIIGAPSSGKSYLLASMTWLLRKTLLKYFQLSMSDASPEANQIVNGYHEKLFLSPEPDQPVYLPKTEKEGDLYEEVTIAGQTLQCAKPFMYAVQPQEGHPGFDDRRHLSRALCLYDNAGEHFLPGFERSNSPVTQHLSLSRALLFLFDPTQHAEFRKVCHGKSSDPQMKKQVGVHQQHQVLEEAAKRIRDQTGLVQSEKYSRPLIVVVTKYDAWNSLTKGTALQAKWAMRPVKNSQLMGLDIDKLRSVSDQIRSILLEHAGEVVQAAEGFSSDVTYIPVSALGRGPDVDPTSGYLTIRPRDINPMWSEVPMLYALHRSVRGLVLGGSRGDSSGSSGILNKPKDPEGPRVWKETGS